jgi:hypothetical protein
MKKQTKQSWLAGITGLTMALCFMSFTLLRGGYSYTLHVNNKLTGQYYLTDKHETPTLRLMQQDLTGKLTVYFNECGEIGQARKLSVRDSNQKVLKEWTFATSTTQHDPMDIAWRDVVALQRSAAAIYYSSARVSKPQLLVHVVISDKKKEASR